MTKLLFILIYLRSIAKQFTLTYINDSHLLIPDGGHFNEVLKENNPDLC